MWKVRLIPTDIRRLPTEVIKTREMPRVNRSVIFWTVCPYLLSLNNPTCLYPIEGSGFRLRWLTYWCTMSMLMLTEVNTVVGLVLTQPGSILNALLFSCPVVHWPHGLQPARLLCPLDSPGKNPGMGCHFLLQGIFPTKELNPSLLHCRSILYHWATRKSL